MADRNFVVKHGLTVGNITLNANNSNFLTTGNVTANYFIGNGSLLTGIATSLTVALSNATGGNVTNSIASVSTLKFDSTSGFGVTDLGSGNALITLGSTFKTWEVAGQPSLVAVGEDTVQFIAGNGISITTSNVSNPKSITFTNTGRSGTNVIVDDFTGNGVQTTFQLSTTPGNINQTIVNYNGVTLLRNSYTLSGANITFVSPPANGSQIEVSTLETGSPPVAINVAKISNGNSNVNIASSNGSITFGVAGNASILTVTGTGANILGTGNVTGNLNAGNLICSAGTVTAVSVTETSSITLKENLNPIPNALDIILQLTGYTYDRKDGTAQGEAGLIAEDVNDILPNLIGYDAEGNPHSINYSKLTVYLIEAVKTLKTELDLLKSQI